MTGVPGAGKGQPEVSPESSHQESDRVQVLQSSGGLLSEIRSLQNLRFQEIFLFGAIEAYFAERSVKKQYVKKLSAIVESQAIEEGFTKTQAELFAQGLIKPILSSYSVEKLKHFEEFIEHKQNLKYLLQTRAHSKREGPKVLKRVVETSIAINQKKNSAAVAKACALLPRIAKIADRLQPLHYFQILDAWAQAGKELDSDSFADFYGKYVAHLEHIEGIQAKRPAIFDQDSVERQDLINEFYTLLMEFPVQMQRLAGLDLALRDVTVIENRQLLQYSIAAFYEGVRVSPIRSVPDLRPRCFDGTMEIPYGLSNQVGIPNFTLPQPAENKEEEIVQLQPILEVFITDPFTMETRSLHAPLPIPAGKTVAQTRAYLQVLYETVHAHQRFEDEAVKLGLSVEEQASLKENFLDFDRQLGQQFGGILGDFNATSNQPRGSFVKRQPEIASLLANPDSKKAAKSAARTKNIFLLEDGKLSLLPSGPGEKHQDIGTFTDEEVKNAESVFLGKRKGSIQLSYPQGASLKLKLGKEEIDEDLHLVMETTIAHEGKEITRKSYYYLEKKDAAAVKKEIVNSRLFERDLLLAKADFLGA